LGDDGAPKRRGLDNFLLFPHHDGRHGRLSTLNFWLLGKIVEKSSCRGKFAPEVQNLALNPLPQFRVTVKILCTQNFLCNNLQLFVRILSENSAVHVIKWQLSVLPPFLTHDAASVADKLIRKT